MPPFFCLYCSEDFKDKNSLSWHRFRGVCSSYTGDKPLKMYPAWGKSDASELRRITQKFSIVRRTEKRVLADENNGRGKKAKVARDEGQGSWVANREKVVNNVKHRAIYDRSMIGQSQRVGATQKERKIGNNMVKSSTTLENPVVEPRTRTKVSIEKYPVKDPRTRNKVSFSHDLVKDPRTRTQVASPQDSRKDPQTRTNLSSLWDIPIYPTTRSKFSSLKDPIKATPAKVPSSSCHDDVKDTSTTSTVSLGTVQERRAARDKDSGDNDVTVRVGGPIGRSLKGRVHGAGILQQHKISLIPKTRVGIEAAANAKAKTFTLEDLGGLRSQPVSVSSTGLFVLMHETGHVVDRALMEDLDATMQKLLSMDADNTLLPTLKTAFGHWYITPTHEELSPVQRTDAVTKEISRSLKMIEREGKEDPEVPLLGD